MYSSVADEEDFDEYPFQNLVNVVLFFYVFIICCCNDASFQSQVKLL